MFEAAEERSEAASELVEIGRRARVKEGGRVKGIRSKR